MNLIHVILSGGVGSRLWPLSKKSLPKQYIPLFENQSLFQLCVLRNRFLGEQKIVVGNKNNRAISQKHLTAIGIEGYSEIVESVPRNTAAAITFAALKAAPSDVLLITPSDHLITNQQVYESVVLEAVDLAKDGYLVTFGIRPTGPETGYGYIKHQGNEVLAFIEKPDLEKAEKMLSEGNYLWNSGMFCFRADVFLEELAKYQPEVLEKSKKAWAQNEKNILPLNLSMEIPSISVDYAVMEHSDKIKVVPAENLGWSDLGTFDSLWQYWKDNGLELNDDKHLVINNSKPVFFIGNQEMIFVETDKAILVMPKGFGQDVKQLYEKLSEDNPDLVE